MRTCNRCGAEKPLEAYERARGGRRRTCRQFRAKRPKNPAVERASYLRRRDRILEEKRAYHARRREERCRAERERQARIPTAVKTAQKREWRRRNPEKARAISLRAGRARRFGRDDASRIYAEALTGDPCCYCGKPMAVIDHIDSVSAGGDSRWANLTAACRRCNGSKHSASLLRFLLRVAA